VWSNKPYGPADAAAVRSWLEARGMGKYAALFEANEVRLVRRHRARAPRLRAAQALFSAKEGTTPAAPRSPRHTRTRDPARPSASAHAR
jgi:hypothetical protein